jgi:arylsulfate sulfotransferase
LTIGTGNGTGDVLWRLGQEGDFTLAGSPDQWFYAQHYPQILQQHGSETKLLAVDNGNFRPSPDGTSPCDGNDFTASGPQPCYSRTAIFNIDEQQKTATLDWDYKPGAFSFWGGSTQQLWNGNIEFCMSQPTPGGSRIVEVSGDPTADLIWTLNIDNQYAYRAVRLPSLYPGITW